jgi:hypothetical protein
VATISSSGLATAVGSGVTQITVVSGGVSATSNVTVAIAGSGSTPVTSFTPTISITPTAQVNTFTGETTQFIATGDLTGLSTGNITNQVQWVSSNTQVATITQGGLATSIGGGTTTITAQSGGTIATVTLTVSVSSTTPTIPNLTIIPGAVNATGAGAQAQLIAIGNLSGNGEVQNLTNNVTWISSSTSVATVTATGLATSQVTPAPGVTYSSTITAIGVTNAGSVITSTILFTVSSPTTGNTTAAVPVLSAYEVGTGTGTITTAAGSAAFIDCGNGGTTCSQNFAQGSTVTLIATPASGSSFAGWTSNCTPLSGNPLSCTVSMTTNESVGATFTSP